MTHAYIPLDATAGPSLPPDFHERSAYMRLYRAYAENDAYWPASAFGEEIAVLLERTHAEPHGAGYRLTDAGIAHWAQIVKQWGAGTLKPARMGKAPLYVVLLATLAEDGAWHGLSTLARNSNRQWTLEVLQRLHKQGQTDHRYDGGWQFQITDEGRAALAGYLEEQAS